MLRELLPTRQVHGDPPRRWFMSRRCDLIVWLGEDGAPTGFQFCYDKDAVEHAFTWMADLGYNHMRVDAEGGDLAYGRGTPLLVANGVFDPARMLELFRAECQLLPPEYVELVSARLRALVDGSRTG